MPPFMKLLLLLLVFAVLPVAAGAQPAPAGPPAVGVVRAATGKSTYIGSWLTSVAKVPLVTDTTLPSVTSVALILPSIGARISV